MLVRIANIFLVSLLVGCVTVTEQSANNQFDKIKAAEARISLGLSYLESKDMIRARENLETAVSYAPDYYRSLIAMAHFYQEVGETDQAEQAYKKALRSRLRTVMYSITTVRFFVKSVDTMKPMHSLTVLLNSHITT